MKYSDFLRSMSACYQGFNWVGNKNHIEATNTCPEPSWLFWIASKINIDKQLLRETARLLIDRITMYTANDRVFIEKTLYNSIVRCEKYWGSIGKYMSSYNTFTPYVEDDYNSMACRSVFEPELRVQSLILDVLMSYNSNQPLTYIAIKCAVAESEIRKVPYIDVVAEYAEIVRNQLAEKIINKLNTIEYQDL